MREDEKSMILIYLNIAIFIFALQLIDVTISGQAQVSYSIKIFFHV